MDDIYKVRIIEHLGDAYRHIRQASNIADVHGTELVTKWLQDMLSDFSEMRADIETEMESGEGDAT